MTKGEKESAERETLLIEHQWGAGYYGERRILLKKLKRRVDPGAGGAVRLAEGMNLSVCEVLLARRSRT